ncbi:Gfo/Idh/MocA family protein [Aeromonas rivipollensis]|jgi:predicted dehydrogenase
MTESIFSQQPVRAAIIGTGMIAQAHYRGIRNAGGQVLGVVDADPNRAAQIAQQWGVSVFDDINAVLANPAVDVIHVCTPNLFHFPLAKQSLLAGKHVICEKPLAIRREDADELASIAEERGLVATVPFIYRYHPMIREARHLIASGDLGPLQLIHGSYLQDWLLGVEDNNWRVDAKLGGQSRAFADIGSHWCDLIEWLTGETFTELVANFHTARKTRSQGSAVTFTQSDADSTQPGVAVTTEDIATVMLRTGNGIPANVTISQVSAGRKNRLWFEIDGADKSLEFDQEQPEQLWVSDRDGRTLRVKDPGRWSDEQRRLASLPPGHVQGYAQCFEAFIADSYASIQGATPAGLPSFRDGQRAAHLIDAVLRSVEQRGWVKI